MFITSIVKEGTADKKTEQAKPQKTFTIEEMFGDNSSDAQELIAAAKVMAMKAQSMGEIRRLQRMLQSKLRILRKLDFLADNS